MNARAALRDIVHLASEIGPREATSDNYAEAAAFVEARFERLGYDVRRTKVAVPSGNSWGTPVRRGTSLNVIAEPTGFDPKEPHVVIGAHLDTVPVAPGAEDNASGVAVMLQLAAMVSQQPAALPVQFIAFGAEEPRGSGDALHHFGSRQHVADLSRSELRAIEAMVSLDRVGVRAGYVPICTATERGTRLRDAMRAAARPDDIATRACTNYTSDHWSYAKAGVPAVRLGSIPYAGYHSRGDVPSVVDRRQLDRVGRTVWAWLRTLN
jgi:Zn-dependent M28 family amino/carboxypeptidase